MSTTTGLNRIRYIERDYREFDLRSLVDELRLEARAAWQVMHQFRKQAAAASNPAMRCDFERMAADTRVRLVHCLAVLNAGLGREGSYHNTYMRRIRRDIDSWKQVAA